jgi:hypothetical protein
MTAPPTTQTPLWHPKTRWVVIAAVIAGVIVLVAIVIAALAVIDARRHGADGGQAPHAIKAGAGSRTTATLDIVSGATSVVLGAGSIGDDLYRVSTPEDSAVAPQMVEAGGVLQLHLNGTGQTGPKTVDIRLNDRVRWTLRFSGGYNRIDAELTAGRIDAVEFDSGTSTIDLTLPKPPATVPVRFNVGAGAVTLHSPADIPVRVRVGSGAGVVRLDGVQHSGVAGGTTFASPGWDGATDRYDVDCAAGVSTLVVDAS